MLHVRGAFLAKTELIRSRTGLGNRLLNLDKLIKVAIERPPLADFDFEIAKQIFKGHLHHRKYSVGTP